MKTKKTKAIIAAVGALVSVLTAAFADDLFSANEASQVTAVLVEQALTVWAVWRVPNKPVPSPYR